MIDRAIEDVRARDVAWDELRQRRVLAAIEARRRDRSTPAPADGARIRWLVAGAIAVAAVLVVAIAGSWWATAQRIELRAIAVAPAPAETMPAPEVDPAQLTFADGSIAQLRDGARVDVEIQHEQAIRLAQRSGRVRYEVAPDPNRAFVVAANGVEVHVIGTVFAVELLGEHVAVDVERGRVRVVAGDRTAELGAGEHLRVEAPGREPPDDDPIVVSDDDAPPSTATPPTAARSAAARSRSSIDDLLAKADAARAAGDPEAAATALRELVSRHPKDPRAYSAYFQLGKVERKRGRHVAAAEAFAACVRRSPSGALTEDARAEAAASWHDAGRHERAHEAAQAYLAQYPNGTHAARMRKLSALLPQAPRAP